ncbi:Metallo-dependent hydrolase [Plenodomus tracheiphilus IPT5]|uniref:adenosine deaminase n=1 Tax=Plenodomus tracheiphilus IPT5 TaxID=1408161 RepID=A0A6A7B9V8_9PLEO|nr:Metallo-dependent hydrolase [Plenodomus tracheiphilus IPT5]
MTAADSPKKRKGVFAHYSNRKIPIQLGQGNAVEMASGDSDPKSSFDAALGNMNAINAYTEEHRELLESEAKDAWDRDVIPRDLSRSQDDQIERRAALIIREIREYERRVTFGNLASEAIPGKHTRDMGGQFLTNKERIDTESELYKIAKLVPKGALLHLHFNAELHPERLLERAREMKNMYIRSICPLLTQQDLDKTETVFMILDEDLVEPDVNLFSEHYPGNATNWKTEEWKYRVWMPWAKFQSEFEQRFGEDYQQPEVKKPKSCAEPVPVKLNPAENWLKSKMVLSQEEAYGFTQTVNGVWARFNQATRCFKGLLNYEGVYKWYISNAIDRMIEENVMYAELRPMLLDKSIPTNDGKDIIDNFGQMQLIVDGVKEKQEKLKAVDKLHQFPFGLKIIYCTPRSIPKPMMQKEMKHCIDLKLKFPDLICGFDLVGAEDRPNHIGYYKDELKAFQRTCEQHNLDIPFMFHAGETLLDTGGSTDPENSNLYDAVVLKSKRIGHGFALMKHPHLVEKFKKSKNSPGICIELCPISNELLHLCRNVKEHPFPELLAAGIPCTVNSDNPSLFSNSMSHEFYQIMVGAPTMSLYSWKQLARWSIDYSCLSKKEKDEARVIHDKSWKQFCKGVVKNYDDLMAGDEIDVDKAEKEYAKSKIPHAATPV